MNGWFFKGAQTNSLRYFSPAVVGKASAEHRHSGKTKSSTLIVNLVIELKD
jgi:hypothetical protein